MSIHKHHKPESRIMHGHGLKSAIYIPVLPCSAQVSALQSHLHLDPQPTPQISGCRPRRGECGVGYPLHQNVPPVLIAYEDQIRSALKLKLYKEVENA